MEIKDHWKQQALSCLSSSFSAKEYLDQSVQ